jgi:hypothetical protein
MTQAGRDKAAATNGMHTALYFWYFLTVLVAGIAGGLLMPGREGDAFSGVDTFGWQGFLVFAIAAAVLCVPVMVFFSLGERILLELMDMRDAERLRDRAEKAEP